MKQIFKKQSNNSGITQSVPLYWGLLTLAFFIALTTRLFSLHQEIPPITFCDEDIFYQDVLKMFHAQSWGSTEFRSGPFNSYPILILAKALSIFVPLSDVQILLLGRLVFPILLGSIAIFPIAEAATILFSNRRIGLIAGFGYLSSEMLLALSRYWYPDYYIVFFSAMVLYFCVIILRGRFTFLVSIFLGLTLSIAFCVKLTALVLVIPVGIALFVFIKNCHEQGVGDLFRTLISKIVVLFLTLISTFFIMNINTMRNIESYKEAQEFNATNYGGVSDKPFEGILAYSFVAFVLMFGIPGIIGLIAGISSLITKKQFSTFALLFSVPVFVIVILGSQKLFINRNVLITAPFLLLLISFGVLQLFKHFNKMRLFRKLFFTTLSLAALSIQFIFVFDSVMKDLKPDSRFVAAEWIGANISENETLGINDVCSGASAAYLAGRNSVLDPWMDEGLNYYVINSYWDSEINQNFRGVNAAHYLLEQKYIHFSYFNDKGLGTYILNIFDIHKPQIPSGFSLMKIIDSNGPQIWILKKD